MFISVCASSVFPGMPLADALAEVRAAGARSYEFWSWWDQDIEAAARAQAAAGLRARLMCTGFVPLTLPEKRGEYLEALARTAECCRKLGCGAIITQVGAAQPGMPREAQHQSIVEGLRKAAALLEGTGIELYFEPLNTKIDHPGYYLTGAEEAFRIHREVGAAHVKVLYDIYHQHITEGVDLDLVTANIGRIGHFHMAGFPGRHEPLDPNEIDYPAILSRVKAAGYDRGFGLEYFPLRGVEGLKETLAALAEYDAD